MGGIAGGMCESFSDRVPARTDFPYKEGIVSLSDNSDRSPAAPISVSTPQPSRRSGAGIHQISGSKNAPARAEQAHQVMLVGTWVVFQNLPASFDHLPDHGATTVYDAVHALSVEARATIDHGVAIDVRVSPQSLLELIQTYRLSATSRVLAALTEAAETKWQEQAVCAQSDPELFFPEKGGATSGAKALCRSCPVKDECLNYALTHDERFGVWGGLSERERRGLTRAGRRNAAEIAVRTANLTGAVRPETLPARRVG